MPKMYSSPKALIPNIRTDCAALRTRRPRPTLALTTVTDAEDDNSSGTFFLSEIANHLQVFFSANFFVIGVVAAIAAAGLNPAFGLRGGPLRPEITVEAFAVSLIFLLNGIALPSSELAAAAGNLKLNVFTQSLNLIVAPLLLWPFFTALRSLHTLPSAVIDGLICTFCLPTTVNMCIVLTGSAGGSVATALFNAVIGNVLGIFLTPLLILKLVPVSTAASVAKSASTTITYSSVLLKLSKKVLLPVALGQLLRLSAGMRGFLQRHKKKFSRATELLLLSIIYTTFCGTFASSSATMVGGFRTLVCLLLGLPALHLTLLACAFAVARLPALGFRRDQQVAAAFCASHKTLAFGMPLLATLFRGDPALGLLSLPLLIVHPMQLLVGGAVVPAFKKYTAEYPSYSSAVILRGIFSRPESANSFENPSVYSDRTWAIIQRARY